MALSFGSIGTMDPAKAASVPLSMGSTVPLSFGTSVPAMSDPVYSLASGGLSYGSLAPTPMPDPRQPTLLSSMSSFLNTFSLGTPVAAPTSPYDDAIIRQARQSGQTTYSPYAAPQVTTAQVDGSADWVSRMRDTLGGVLGMIGSSGDQAGVQQVAYQEPAGVNWPLILLALGAAGAVYYATR